MIFLLLLTLLSHKSTVEMISFKNLHGLLTSDQHSKKKKQLHEFSVKSLLQAFTHVFHWNFRTILFMRSHLLKASRNKSNIRSFYLSRFKQDQEPDYTWKLFSNTLTKFQWVVHKYNNLIA